MLPGLRAGFFNHYFIKNKKIMGWNTGYTIFEQTVIGAYDLGKLDKDLLTVLMEPYRGTDIDSGGSQGLKTKDGKDVMRVVIETWGLEYPPPFVGEKGSDEWDDYQWSIGDLFDEVAEGVFGWE